MTSRTNWSLYFAASKSYLRRISASVCFGSSPTKHSTQKIFLQENIYAAATSSRITNTQLMNWIIMTTFCLKAYNTTVGLNKNREFMLIIKATDFCNNVLGVGRRISTCCYTFLWNKRKWNIMLKHCGKNWLTSLSSYLQNISVITVVVVVVVVIIIIIY